MTKKINWEKFQEISDLEKVNYNKDEICIIGTPEIPLAESVRENILNHVPSYVKRQQIICVHLIMRLSGRADNLEDLKLKILLWLVDTFRLLNIIYVGYNFDVTKSIYIMDAFVTLIAKNGSIGISNFDSKEADWEETYMLYLDDPIYYLAHRIKHLIDDMADIQYLRQFSDIGKSLNDNITAFESALHKANISGEMMMAKYQHLIEGQKNIDLIRRFSNDDTNTL